jgi:predicted ATP-grasp superfamily ATP-dependent carboligase
VTTRALAVSAARAGYRVIAVDAFGDLDLQAAAEVIALPPEQGTRFHPLAAAEAVAAVAASFAAYTSNYENFPVAVARLAGGRRLLGNSPDVLKRVRDPLELMRVLRQRGFATPETRATAHNRTALRSWLLKPRRSGGGHGITVWRHRRPVPRNRYLQERIDGVPGSLVFAADGQRAVPLGLTRQLVAEPRFGARGFRYCGSLLAPPPALFRDDKLSDVAARLASTVTSEFGLVGLNGLDFIARDGVPYPIEVNPRFSASMELFERAHGFSMFRLHAQACAGTLPERPPMSAGVEGKAVVFARRDVMMGDTTPWLADPFLADIPHPGERIRRGHPICTVFARASNAASCHRLLIRRAATVYRTVESRRRGAA